jgi:opacity protein-like surface antigen
MKRSALLFALGLALFLFAPAALADAKSEAAATGLQKKAMDDYIATDFAKAQDKLNKAIAQCGDAKCGAGLRAKLLRDLGVVQIGGAIDKEKGIANFVEALKIDPGIALDPDIKTKDLDAAFAEAKKRASGGGGEEPKPKKKPAAAGGEPPEGDFAHMPAPQQQVRTAIPVYTEYNGDQQLSRVVARYKSFGMADWKNADLKRMGEKGWGGLIPCADVQQGVVQYFLTGYDSNNDPVANGGDRNNSFKVQITQDRPDDPPHLPQQAPPAQCQDTGDCPPDFPGCKKPKKPVKDDESKEPTGKEEGELCEEDAECKSNSCTKNHCTESEGGESPKKGPRFWVGLMGSLDWNFVPSVEDACKLKNDAFPLNDQNYYCVNGSGGDYPTRDPAKGKAANDAIVSSANRGSDKVAGGGALGNIRIMLTADYAVTGNILLGARVGLVLNNYPGEAAQQDGKRFSAPVHLELRFTYVFGKDALWKKGFAPYAMVGAGVAPFETKIGVQTIEQDAATNSAVKHQVDAWHIAGPGFVGVGGGLRFAPVPKFALMLGLRADFAFLNAFVPSVGPELGGAIGF